MSYLNISSFLGSDFYKAVISLWFRVPQASINACLAVLTTTPPARLPGIIPLVTFGRPGREEVYGPVFRPYCTQVVTYGTMDPTFVGIVNVPGGAFIPVDQGSVDLDPSYIGIQCVADGTLNFVASFQTNQRATLTQFQSVATGAVNVGADDIHTLWAASGIADVSVANTGKPESYDISVALDPVTFPDHWHHVLISCDLTRPVSTFASTGSIASSVTSYNLLWIALDDINYTAFDALPNWVEGGAPNATMTAVTSRVAYRYPIDQLTGIAFEQQQFPSDSVIPPAGTYTNATGAPPVNFGTYTATAFLPATPIPMAAGPIGLPASAAFVDNIYICEMAELQLFTDRAFDTGDANNRRAFIDFPRDENGNQKPGGKQPVDPEIAQSYLGKIPDVLLHRSRNWIEGKNTGSGSQFTPTALIRRYKPDPELGK